ncbi:hypothetical protein ACIRNY_11100 [Capnocytophaga canimorsus]|uniref:hypothetical protein n=1 Tax=Capnocytophaga canimorsus TaxID=28188 RepID=UPI0037D2705A
MKKSGGQIEYDIYNLLKNKIQSFIKGGVYLAGTREHNSQKEDAVISFLTGLDNDIQVGKININIFVPNIHIGGQKKVKNIARILEIEAFMIALIEETKSEYQLQLAQTINSFEEAEIGQYFVNVALKYKRFSLNY